MKMKYFLGSLLGIMISISAIAQNNPGADYISLGDLKMAKDYFMKRMRQAPAESNYYLGEIAYQEGNLAEAQKNYEAGIAADPTSALNRVGLAKLQLKSNPKEAEDQLKEVQKKNKKDVNVILAIAKAYLDNDMLEETQEKIKDAYKADKKNPYIFIFEADMIAKDPKKIGEAAQLYDQAIYFDENCALAYLKGARVYERINRNHAIDMLKKVTTIQPDNALAVKILAAMYSEYGFYPQAIEAYKKYFEAGSYDVVDIRRYAAAEYFTNNFAESMRLVQEGMNSNPNDFVLNRLLMYNSNSTKDFETGLAAGEKFFSLPLNEIDSILPLDYKTYANILNETGNKAKAMEQYKKLADLDPKNAELQKEMATVCASDKMYPEAAEFYKRFIELSDQEKIDAQNYYQLGRYYFLGGVTVATDTVSVSAEEAKAKSMDLYKKADETFAVVSERVPDSHLGYYNRAQTNYRMDPLSEQGLAKPHYEKTIEVILAKGDASAADNAILVEAYSYLSYYYYLQFDSAGKAEDKAQVKNYAGKVLELDPENQNGKTLFDFANQ